MTSSPSLQIKNILVAVASLLAISAGSLPAAAVLQQSSNTSGQSWATPATWSNNEAAGTGNDYFTNGYILRTPDSPAGSVSFPGDSLTVNAGTGGATGALNLKAGTTSITNLSIGSGNILNGNASSGNLPATINITNLNILAAATVTTPAGIRGSNSGNDMTINVTNLAGSGYLSIGVGASTTRDYSLGIVNASTFTGTINLSRGNLTLSEALSLSSDAVFTMNTTNTSLSLSNNLSVWSFSFGTALPQGDYTSAQLNTHYGTSVFSGPGLLSVVPEPASGTLFLFAASTFILMSRAKRRS